MDNEAVNVNPNSVSVTEPPDESADTVDDAVAAAEGQSEQPPPMAVVEAPSPICSDAEDENADQAQTGLDNSVEESSDRLVQQEQQQQQQREVEEEDDCNGAALLQQLSESLRQQTDTSSEDQRESREADHRDAADRKLEDHRRELDQLQSNLRRELAEEKRRLDQRLATRRQQVSSAADSADDKPSRLALDNPIHVALNLRPDSAIRSYLPAEMLSSSGRGAPVSGHSQHRVLPSTLTSEELRLLEDVRQRLSRASFNELEQQQQPPPPQPRPRQQREQPQQQQQHRQRVAPPVAPSVPPGSYDNDDDDQDDDVDPLVRSTHERLAGVSERIRRYQQDSGDYFNQSVLLGCSPTERGEADFTTVNGRQAAKRANHSELAADFSSRGLGAHQRYSGLSPGSVNGASAGSPPSLRGSDQQHQLPPALSLLHQLSPADDDAEVAAIVNRSRRRNHPSASSIGVGDRQVGATAAAAAEFEEERRHLLRELRDARAEASRANELRHQLEAAHSALREAAEGVAQLRREHAVALARERAETERLRVRLAEARAETDRLKRRLAGAESERMFLRNRERGVGSHPLSGGDCSEELQQERQHSRLSMTGADCSAGGSDFDRRSPTEALRQSLADLERRQLIDSLPQARDSMSSVSGSGGVPSWDRDTQLAEIRTLEQRYDQLQLEKRRVETALTHVPSVGSAKYGRQSREDKERLEKRLDIIDRELGSLRITLRQFHVIKSAC